MKHTLACTQKGHKEWQELKRGGWWRDNEIKSLLSNRFLKTTPKNKLKKSLNPRPFSPLSQQVTEWSFRRSKTYLGLLRVRCCYSHWRNYKYLPKQTSLKSILVSILGAKHPGETFTFKGEALTAVSSSWSRNHSLLNPVQLLDRGRLSFPAFQERISICKHADVWSGHKTNSCFQEARNSVRTQRKNGLVLIFF